MQVCTTTSNLNRWHILNTRGISWEGMLRSNIWWNVIGRLGVTCELMGIWFFFTFVLIFVGLYRLDPSEHLLKHDTTTSLTLEEICDIFCAYSSWVRFVTPSVYALVLEIEINRVLILPLSSSPSSFLVHFFFPIFSLCYHVGSLLSWNSWYPPANCKRILNNM